MAKYHLSVGNSNTGAVGFCAVVEANSPEEALKIIQNALPEDESIRSLNDNPAIDYIQVYFNSDAITIQDFTEND